MSVEIAISRELSEMGPAAQGSTLGATALALARELDGDNSATSKSMCAKSMIDVLRELRQHAPQERKTGQLYNITDRHQKRRQGLSRTGA